MTPYRRRGPLAHSSRFATFALMLSAVTALASCSSSGSDDHPASGHGNTAGANVTTSDSASQATSLTKVSFAGAATPNGDYANYAYGVKEGIFRAHGIDLKLVWPANQATASRVPLIAKGTFTVGTVQPTAIMKDQSQGVHTIGIFGALQVNPTGITLRKSQGVTNPRQLKGLTLGVSTGSANIEVTKKYLAHYGLNEHEVHVVTLSLASMAQAFLAHKIDGIIAYPYSFDPQFEKQGIATTALYFRDAGINEIQQVVAVGKSWASAHPKALANLVAAFQEATAGAIAHPDTAAKDLIAVSPAGSTSPLSVVEAAWKGTIPYLVTENGKGHPLGYMAPEDWESTLQYGQQFLSLGKEIKTTGSYTNKYIPNKYIQH